MAELLQSDKVVGREGVMRRYGWRGWRVVPLVLLLLSMAFTACGNTRAPNEVVYWTTDTSKIDIQAQQEIVDTFNRANPDLHVRLLGVPGGVTNLAPLVTAVRSGTGPDVYFLDRFTVS